MGLRTTRGLACAHTVQGREAALGSPSSVVEPLPQSWAVWDFAVLLETHAEEGLRCPLLPSGAVSGDRGAVMPPGWALAQEVGGMFCLARALKHRLL